MYKGAPVGAHLWYGAGFGNKAILSFMFFYDLVQFRFFSLVIPVKTGIQDKRSLYVPMDLRVKPEDDRDSKCVGQARR